MIKYGIETYIFARANGSELPSRYFVHLDWAIEKNDKQISVYKKEGHRIKYFSSNNLIGENDNDILNKAQRLAEAIQLIVDKSNREGVFNDVDLEQKLSEFSIA